VSRAAARPAVPLALTLSFAGGLLVAGQSQLNGEFGDRAGSAVWAALVSFGSGLVLVGLLVAAVPRVRRAVRPALTARLPWWTYLGGVGGATLVAVAAAAVPVVGVATFTVGAVAGQAVGGLLVDRTRLVPGEPRPLSSTRVAGAALAVIAVGVVRLGHETTEVPAPTVLALLVAAAVAGLGVSVQQALNGRVQRATGEPLLATLGNFAVGAAVLAPVVAVVVAARHGPSVPWPGDPLLYVGGGLGVFYITVASWAVRLLGVLRLGLATVAGQLAGGVLLDPLSPARTGGVDAATVAGVLLTLAGITLAGRTRPTREPIPAGVPGRRGSR